MSSYRGKPVAQSGIPPYIQPTTMLPPPVSIFNSNNSIRNSEIMSLIFEIYSRFFFNFTDRSSIKSTADESTTTNTCKCIQIRTTIVRTTNTVGNGDKYTTTIHIVKHNSGGQCDKNRCQHGSSRSCDHRFCGQYQ